MGLDKFTGAEKIGTTVAWIMLPGMGAGLVGITGIPLVYLGERDGHPYWKLMGEVRYYDVVLDYEFVIPDGYEFDLATIPRAVWWMIAPFELSTLAPLLHDWLYEWKGKMPDGKIFDEQDADDLFLRVMKAEGVSRFRRNAAYLAVRTFGPSFWNAPAA